MLPPEPRERGAPAQPSRRSSDQARETPGARSAREWAPRREDPPRRSDSPRDTDRSGEGEPPRRLDPPRGPERALDGEPPRREDPPGLAKREEASSGPVNGSGEITAEGAVVEAEEAAALCAAIETIEGATVVPGQVVDPALPTSTASPAVPSASETALVTGSQITSGEPDPQALNLGADTHPAVAKTPLPEGQVPQAQNPELQAVQAVEVQGSEVPEETALESETHEGKVADGQVPGAALPVGEPAQATPPTEQATAMASAQAAGPTVSQAEPVTRNPSGPMQQMDAIGAKAASATRQEHISVRERGDSNRPETRIETANPTPRESSASEAGLGTKVAAKPDQLLQQAIEATSASQPAASVAPSREPSSNAAQVPAAPIRVVSEVPLGAVPVEIGLKSLAGVNHFEIRLDPAELGRIEVRLEIDQEGGVKAHLTVDKVETLALLQRDSRTLERAFEQAGLKPTDGSVDLSLRDQQAQGQGRHDQGGGDQRRDGSRSSNPEMARQDIEPPPAQSLSRHWRGAAGVDVLI